VSVTLSGVSLTLSDMSLTLFDMFLTLCYVHSLTVTAVFICKLMLCSTSEKSYSQNTEA